MTEQSELDATGGAVGILLRARADSVYPDLERLTVVGIRSGRRIRARRRIGVAVGLGAGAAVIGVVGGHSVGDVNDAAPNYEGAGPSQAPASLTLDEEGALVTSLIESVAPGTPSVLQPLPNEGRRGRAIVVILSDQLTDEQKQAISAGLPDGWAATYLAAGSGGLRQAPPVTFSDPQWSCEWYVEDDKGSCQNADGLHATVVWRPESHYDKYSGGYADYFVSAVRDGIFVTIQPAPGMTRADAEHLGATLTWVEAP